MKKKLKAFVKKAKNYLKKNHLLLIIIGLNLSIWLKLKDLEDAMSNIANLFFQMGLAALGQIQGYEQIMLQILSIFSGDKS